MQPLWKTVWRFLKKLKIELSYDAAFTLLDIYPENTKMLIQRDTSTPIPTAALCTIDQSWKLPQCASTDEWIKRSGKYTYTQTHRHTDTHTHKWNLSHKKE